MSEVVKFASNNKKMRNEQIEKKIKLNIKIQNMTKSLKKKIQTIQPKLIWNVRTEFSAGAMTLRWVVQIPGIELNEVQM